MQASVRFILLYELLQLQHGAWILKFAAREVYVGSLVQFLVLDILSEPLSQLAIVGGLSLDLPLDSVVNMLQQDTGPYSLLNELWVYSSLKFQILKTISQTNLIT